MNGSRRSPPEALPPLQTDEFLPPLKPWVVRGTLLLVGLLVSGVGIASFVPYHVTVPAIATLRPVNEVNSVTVVAPGTLRRVLVKENQSVKQGDILAELGVIDPVQLSRLQTRRQRLQSYIRQYQTQLDQVNAQLQTLNQQIVTAANVQPIESQDAFSDLHVQTALQRLGSQELAQGNRWRLQRDRLLQLQAGLTRQIGYDQISLQAIDSEVSKVAILAPTDGTLLKLNFRNPGQSLQAGEVVAQIVPTPITLIAKARVSVQDISQVEVGQPAQLRISAYPYPEYGVLAGTIQAIAPDATALNHPTTGMTMSYYEVTIQPQQPYLVKGDRRYLLQPGMEAQADIIGRQETWMQAFLRRFRLWAEV